MLGTLSIDPGIRDCGISYFDVDGELRAAALIVNPVKSGNDYAAIRSMACLVRAWRACGHLPANGPREIACEYPRIYTVGKQIVRGGDGRAHATDPNDLLPLVGVGAAIGALFPDAKIVRYYPDEWKGQLPKIAMNMRAMGRLSPAERARVDAEDPDPAKPKAKGHNVWDAVGIGLHHLGRLSRERVIPR